MTMLADTKKVERKKAVKDFLGILVFPILLVSVSAAFFRMAIVAFTGQPSADSPLGSSNVDNFWLPVGITYLFSCFYWGLPAFLYIKNPGDILKARLKRRLANIYRDVSLMILALQVFSLAALAAGPGGISKPALAAAAVSLLAQAALMVVFVDELLSRQKFLMTSLYSPEELSRLRQGFSMPAYIKISLVAAGLAVLPFSLVYVAAYNRVPWPVLYLDLINMLFISAILLCYSLASVYKGIQLPLNGLIAKMNCVAAGEYPSTSIYFSDEIAHLKAGFNNMVEGLREREELQNTFGKYLSIEIARELLKNKKVNLGGEDIEAAVMFCDIRNFTPLSEKLAPTRLIDFLNEYFRYITPPITAHNGVINKFMGDAVMAVYTPLLGSSAYAADAVRAASDMRGALAEFNASGITPAKVEFGIGVHTGRLVSGNVGTSSRLEYTFIGDTVNIAARLESKSKEFNTDILISAPTLEKARASLDGKFKFEFLGEAVLKGKTETVGIYKLC